ncbi:hypothetical protein PIB30_037502 [Stylosanthes scabra]|uniref:Uncharacterized protein n=1 Tax=Stylosanthes scabra TaxID=79078 RepID=A0ABU6YCI5_9FABA|nr:hypothetical protein [Stylosanthes scabra]
MFVKLGCVEEQYPFYLDEFGLEKFPLYWYSEPVQILGMNEVNEESAVVIDFLEQYAEFGAEVAGESERNEKIATNLEGHSWSLYVCIPWSHAYESKRTHRSIPASINRGAFHNFKGSPLPHLA